MKRKLTELFVIVGIVFLVAACGPVYRTVYTFRPPQNPHGQTCIMQCENIKMQCRTHEEYRLRSCEDENRIAQLEYERCLAMNYDRCWDRSSYCGSPDYRHCAEDYRICYQNCGGQVFSREICVSGCERR